MEDQVRKNQELVNNLMAQAAANKGAQDALLGNDAVISVDVAYTAESGRHYEGTLFFRRPSSMDYLRMGAIKSELMRANGVRPIIEVLPNGRLHESMAHVDNSIIFLARALSAFDTLLTGTVPAWFQNYRDLPDTDLLLQVYEQFDVALASFRHGAQGAPAGDGQAGAGPAPVANP